ncbi:hypothetical protein E5D57_000075 [Metarhizium anisopliae]|nr:hypothetical protein E5D57_000075 [Metarhizium anisopliae]
MDPFGTEYRNGSNRENKPSIGKARSKSQAETSIGKNTTSAIQAGGERACRAARRVDHNGEAAGLELARYLILGKFEKKASRDVAEGVWSIAVR